MKNKFIGLHLISFIYPPLNHENLIEIKKTSLAKVGSSNNE